MIPITAQAQAGFYVTPSFSIAEVYDDNIFSASSERGREGDMISRFSPGIKAGYQSAPLTLLGHYTFDAEVFADHPELSTVQARQRALLDFGYLPNKLLTLSFAGAYVDTVTPRELNLETGIEPGRVRAQRLSLNPSIAYKFDPLITVNGDYEFRNDRSLDVSTDRHTAIIGFDRRLTRRDTMSFAYTLRHFSFGDDDTRRADVTSHALTPGVTHQLTPRTSLELRAGPRFTDGSVDAEVSASIDHQLKRGRFTFTYSRAPNIVSGRVGTVTTDRFAATVIYRPLRFLEVSAMPSFFRNRGTDVDANIYRVKLNATYRLAKHVALQGSYEFSLQEGRIQTATTPVGRSGESVYHNIILLGLTFSYPSRLDGEGP